MPISETTRSASSSGAVELNRIDVTNTEHTVPNYAHKIVRSVWSGDGNAGAHSDDDSLDVGPHVFYRNNQRSA